jgi:hypothetical protein
VSVHPPPPQKKKKKNVPKQGSSVQQIGGGHLKLATAVVVNTMEKTNKQKEIMNWKFMLS